MAGWGKTNIDALKERVELYVAEEKYGPGYKLAKALVQKLSEKAKGGGRERGHYLDLYYLMVVSVYRGGKADNDPKVRAETLNAANRDVAQLEKEYPDFGGEPWRTRFASLLSAEPDLRGPFAAAYYTRIAGLCAGGKDENFTEAANLLRRFEGWFPDFAGDPRFARLLQDNAKLKTAYDNLKK